MSEQPINNWREYIAPGLAIKVLGVLLLLFFFALMVNFYYTINGEKEILRQQMNREGNNLAKASAIFATESLLIEDYPVLSTYTDGLLKNHPDLVSISISRADKKVVASSNRPLVQAEQVQHYYTDVLINDTLIGFIQIKISTKNHQNFVAAHLKAMILQSLVIFLTLAILLFVIFRRMITDPIHQLAKQTEYLKEGNLEHSIQLNSSGELNKLAAVLNEMRINLKLSQDEITAQNRLLDLRVAERTQELKATNEELIATHSQLLQSEKMAAIGQLSAGVAHEINNPIGFVTSNIDMLGQWGDSLLELIDLYHCHMPETNKLISHKKEEIDYDYIKEEFPLLMADTLDGLTRVSTIVADLKNFAHIDDNTWRKADLIKGLHSTLNIVKNEIKYKAQIEFNLQPIPQVICIASQINQVFLNIIVNASQAIEKEGLISFSNKICDNQVCISISDNGRGIAETDLDRIFEPFYTTKAVGEGTGLGLSLSYSIIKSHQGRIEVSSKIDKGTTFNIWLPINQPHLQT